MARTCMSVRVDGAQGAHQVWSAYGILGAAHGGERPTLRSQLFRKSALAYTTAY